MIHFIFKVTRSKKENFKGYVELWVVKSNSPTYLGRRHFTFESNDQAVMSTVDMFRALPRKYFEETPSGTHKFLPWTLKEAGVATFHDLS